MIYNSAEKVFNLELIIPWSDAKQAKENRYQDLIGGIAATSIKPHSIPLKLRFMEAQFTINFWGWMTSSLKYNDEIQ